jgi:hypothetical protein
VVQQNLGRRPIIWSVTTGNTAGGLSAYVVQQGLGYRVMPVPADARSPDVARTALGLTPLDVPVTARLARNTYRYAGLLSEAGRARLDAVSADIARTLALPAAQLALAYAARRDSVRAREAASFVARLSDDPQLQEMLRRPTTPAVRAGN